MKRNHDSLGLICTLLILVLTAASGYAQTTWYVDDDAPNDPGPDTPSVSDPLEDGSPEHPFDAIQEGVDAAAEGDTVSVAPGFYHGAGNVEMILQGKSVSVVGSRGDGVCRIECNPGEVAFNVGSSGGRSISISRFEIYNGGSPGDNGCGVINCGDADVLIDYCGFASSDGPSIQVENSNAAVNDCSFFNCDVEQLVCSESVVSLTSCDMRRNHGSPVVGTRSSVRIDRCDIEENDAVGFRNRILSLYRSDLEVTSSRIVRNVGGDCGGIYVGVGTASLIDTEISYNVTLYESGYGAGILADRTVLDVINCRLEHNNGGWEGGAINTQYSDCMFINTLIAKNESMHTGGAGYCWRSSHLGFVNCTIADNESESAVGGLYCRDATEAVFENCIFWNNASGDACQLSMSRSDLEPAFYRVAFCDIQGGRDGVSIDEDSTLAWGPGNIDVDPLFVDPALADYHLHPLSPCIDAGCNCAVPEDRADLDGDGDTLEYMPFDLGGIWRFYDVPYLPDSGSGLPPVVDLGAYECGVSGTPPPVPGDLDGDRLVTLTDLAILLSNYGLTDSAGGADGDMNCDGNVDLNDLVALLARYM